MEQDGVLLLKVPERTTEDQTRFDDSACPLDIAGFSLGMLVEPNEAFSSLSGFAALADLHGLGTQRSWYAQIGYDYRDGQLSYFCQAYSKSSDAPRYWQRLRPAQFSTWTNFRIDILSIEEDWGYAFRYLIDGEEVCHYQPPRDWDGDNRHQVIWRAASIWLPEPNLGPEDIRVLVDDYEGFVSPACRRGR